MQLITNLRFVPVIFIITAAKKSAIHINSNPLISEEVDTKIKTLTADWE